MWDPDWLLKRPLVLQAVAIQGKCSSYFAVICPDPYKAGSNNNTEGGGRKLNENKLLSSKNK